MNDFLPENYEIPSSGGNYYKLEQGENRFRILASPLMGNEYWNHENKPVRRPTGIRIIITDIREEKDGSLGRVKHFWAMPVWDYKSESVKILQITQKSILTAIKELAKDEDWGTPLNYDLSITRTGEGLETEYNVKPKPAKFLEKNARDAWEKLQADGFDISELLESGDPFNPTKRSTDKKEGAATEESISDDIEI